MGRPLKQRGYNGNELLKSTKVNIEWTQERIDEFTRCADDIKYFIEKYVNIVTVDDGKSQFKLRDYQSQIIDTFTDSRFVCLMIGRQSGKCAVTSETITIKNKKTGIVETIPIGDLYKRFKTL